MEVEDSQEVMSDEELYNAFINNSSNKSFTKFDFDDPVDLAHNICDTLIAKTHELHDWQIQTLLYIAKKDSFTKADYLEFFLAANNGSGKDAYVIALLAIFFSLTIIRHRTIISTSSSKQLKRQTIPYIQSLAAAVNKKFVLLGIIPEGEKIFIIQSEHIICTVTGSEIVLFVTDDPGKAEGFHPWPDCPTQELCLILNEAKSIPDIMYDHFRKCTYNRWIEVSSTGTTGRHFYSEFNSSLDWNDYIKISAEEQSKIRKLRRRVTAYDCPHISHRKIERAIEEHGRDSFHVKTTFFSEFASSDSLNVIDREKLDECIEANIPLKDLGIGLRAGLDIGGGVCPSVLTVIKDNLLVAQRIFTDKNTIKTALWCIKMFKEYNLLANNIFGDDNGLGQGVIDAIRDMGYSIRRVRNQFPAIDKATYGNLGAELYARVAVIIENKLFNFGQLSKEEGLLGQLSTRVIERRGQYDKIFLQSKEDLISEGGESPDKADSFVLAFTGLSKRDFLDEENKDAKPQKENYSTQVYTSEFLVGKIRSTTLYPNHFKNLAVRKKEKNIFNLLDRLYEN